MVYCSYYHKDHMVLFDKKHNRRIKTAWTVFSILIILSMVLMYAAPALVL